MYTVWGARLYRSKGHRSNRPCSEIKSQDQTVFRAFMQRQPTHSFTQMTSVTLTDCLRIPNARLMFIDSSLASCFSPQRAGKASGAEIPQKWEKLENSPGRTPENGKIGPKKGKNYSENTFLQFFGNFSVILGVGAGGGEFCNFSPLFGDFRPGGFPGPLRGKTTRNSSLSEEPQGRPSCTYPSDPDHLHNLPRLGPD